MKQAAQAASGDPPRPPPWWTRPPVRLSALLVCLGLAVLGLFATGATVLSTSKGSARAEGLCGPIATPRLANVPLTQLASLRADVLPVIELPQGRRYAWGTVTPEDVWSDDSPRSLRSSHLAGELWPASYEIREWAPDGDDIAADAFLFANPKAAHTFFDSAASPNCHHAGTVQAAAEPPGARDLTWTNPDSALEQDLFLLRGSRVYRVVVVPAQRASTSSPSDKHRAGLLTVNRLACALQDAGCV